jgi:hypothetical protein
MIRYLDVENGIDCDPVKFTKILNMAFHPSLSEFNMVVEEPINSDTDTDTVSDTDSDIISEGTIEFSDSSTNEDRESVGHHLWAANAQEYFLDELKNTVAEFRKESKIEMSSLIIGCRWKRAACEEADLPPEFLTDGQFDHVM